MQERQAALHHHHHSSLVEVQGWSQVPRGQPLFHSITVHESYPAARRTRQDGAGIRIRGAGAYERTNYPLTVIVQPGARLGIGLSHDLRRIDADASLFELADRRNERAHVAPLPAGKIELAPRPLDHNAPIIGGEAIADFEDIARANS